MTYVSESVGKSNVMCRLHLTSLLKRDIDDDSTHQIFNYQYVRIFFLKKVGRSFLGTLQTFLLAGFTRGEECKLSLLRTALAGGI